MPQKELEIWVVIIGSSALLLFLVGIFIFTIVLYQKKKINFLKQQLQDKNTIAITNEEKTKAVKELNTVKDKVAMDLHDDVSASLSTIRIYSDLLTKMQKKPGAIEEYTTKLSNTVNELAANVRTLVWSLNEDNDTLGNFEEFIHNYVFKYFENVQLKVAFKSTILNNNQELPGIIRKQLYLCIKEILHNALKYSQATELKLEIIQIQKDQLQITITDNGIGITENIELGNGLKNMEKRMAAIGGSLKIENNNGAQFTLVCNI